MPERPNMIPIDHNKPRVAPLGLNVPPKTQVAVDQDIPFKDKRPYPYYTKDIPYPADSKDFSIAGKSLQQTTKHTFDKEKEKYNKQVKKDPSYDMGNLRSTGTTTYSQSIMESYRGLAPVQIPEMLKEAQENQYETLRNPSPEMRMWDPHSTHMPDLRMADKQLKVSVTDGVTKGKRSFAGYQSDESIVITPPKEGAAKGKSPLHHEALHGLQTKWQVPDSIGMKFLKKNEADRKPMVEEFAKPHEAGAYMGDLKSAYYREYGKEYKGDASGLIDWGIANDVDEIGFKGFKGVIDHLEKTHKEDPTSPSPDSFKKFLTGVMGNVVKADDGPKPLMMNDGGKVPGVGNTDSQLAMLTPGEVVKTKEQVKSEESAQNTPSPAPSPSPTEVEAPKTPAQVVQEHRDKTQKDSKSNLNVYKDMPHIPSLGKEFFDQGKLHTAGGLKGPFGVVSPGTGPLGLGVAAATIGSRFASHVIKSLEKNKPTATPTPPAKVPTKPVDPKKDAYERIKREREEKKEREKKEREDKEKEPKPVEPVPEPKPVEPKPLEPLPPIKLPPRPVPPVPNPYKPNVPRTPNPFKPNGPKNPQPYKPQEPAVPNPFVEPKPVTKPTPKPTIPDRRVDPVPEPVPPVPVPDPIPKPPVPVPKPKEDTTSTTETENKKSEGPHTETETETQTKLEQETNPPPKKVETGEKEPKPASPQNIPALMMPQGHVQSFPSIITGIPTHSAPSFEKTHLEINYYTELGF